jgi:hypothetical protein
MRRRRGRSQIGPRIASDQAMQLDLEALKCLISDILKKISGGSRAHETINEGMQKTVLIASIPQSFFFASQNSPQ